MKDLIDLTDHVVTNDAVAICVNTLIPVNNVIPVNTVIPVNKVTAQPKGRRGSDWQPPRPAQPGVIATKSPLKACSDHEPPSGILPPDSSVQVSN